MIFIDEAWKSIKKKIGKTWVTIIGLILLGVVVAIFATKGYSKYVVSPDTLHQTADSLKTKIDKSEAKINVDIIESKLDNLQREKTELEDKIDVPKPKTRHIQRLKEINKRIEKLEKSKEESMDILKK